jgi:hypothetical protein
MSSSPNSQNGPVLMPAVSTYIREPGTGTVTAARIFLTAFTTGAAKPPKVPAVLASKNRTHAVTASTDIDAGRRGSWFNLMYGARLRERGTLLAGIDHTSSAGRRKRLVNSI